MFGAQGNPRTLTRRMRGDPPRRSRRPVHGWFGIPRSIRCWLCRFINLDAVGCRHPIQPAHVDHRAAFLGRTNLRSHKAYIWVKVTPTIIDEISDTHGLFSPNTLVTIKNHLVMAEIDKHRRTCDFCHQNLRRGRHDKRPHEQHDCTSTAHVERSRRQPPHGPKRRLSSAMKSGRSLTPRQRTYRPLRRHRKALATHGPGPLSKATAN